MSDPMTELRETAAWLREQADAVAALGHGKIGMPAPSTVAARLRGRAVLLETAAGEPDPARDALRGLLAVAERMDAEGERPGVTDDEYLQALAQARAALTPEGAPDNG